MPRQGVKQTKFTSKVDVNFVEPSNTAHGENGYFTSSLPALSLASLPVPPLSLHASLSPLPSLCSLN